MGLVQAGAGRGSSDAEQSSPALKWLTPLQVPAVLSTGGTWERTAVWLSPALDIVQSTTLAPHTALQPIEAWQATIPTT